MMRAAFLLVSALFSSQCLAAKVLSFPISRIEIPPADLGARDVEGRATIYEELLNNITLYQATVTIGTPPQTFSLQIDTGSSDIFILDKSADQCINRAIQAANHGGCFGGLYDSSKSSTFQTILKGGFSIKYADQTGSSGDLIADDFTIGGQKIKALEMGLAFKTTTGRGVMGIGYDTNEASQASGIYPNLIDQMVNQNLINSKTYSLYLDDLGSATGSILFGGVDTAKFIGTLQSVPILPTRGIYREFNVLVTSISVTNQTGSSSLLTGPTFAQPFLLDSGTTLSYLPSSIVTTIARAAGAVQGSSVYYVDCDLRRSQSAGYFSFQFNTNGPTINVPIAEMILTVRSGSNVCVLAMLPATTAYILGDSFLRSAYVVYDLTHNQIGLAQSNFDSTNSNIVELKPGDNGVPAYAGVGTGSTVEAQTSAAPTFGIIIGPSGLPSSIVAPSTSSSGTAAISAAGSQTSATSAGSAGSAGTATSTGTSTTKSAAAVPRTGMEGSAAAFMALAFAGACVLLGGSLMW